LFVLVWFANIEYQNATSLNATLRISRIDFGDFRLCGGEEVTERCHDQNPTN
jgi:hypothetical protein